MYRRLKGRNLTKASTLAGPSVHMYQSDDALVRETFGSDRSQFVAHSSAYASCTEAREAKQGRPQGPRSNDDGRVRPSSIRNRDVHVSHVNSAAACRALRCAHLFPPFALASPSSLLTGRLVSRLSSPSCAPRKTFKGFSRHSRIRVSCLLDMGGPAYTWLPIRVVGCLGPLTFAPLTLSRLLYVYSRRPCFRT